MRRNWPQKPIEVQDIRIAQVKIKANLMKHKSAMEALLWVLNENGVPYTKAYDTINRLTHIFLADPVSTTDATYKTNRFNMPLLNIVGCTSMKMTFQAGICFLWNEKEKDYWWTMIQLRKKLVCDVSKLPPRGLLHFLPKAL